MSEAGTFEVRGAQYELSIPINALVERVWRGLTDQLGSWWLPDFHMLGADSIVTLELQAGGRLYEQNGDQELLWYTVLAVVPQQSLSLVGNCTPEFGGPLTTTLAAKLTADGDVTTLAITDSLVGRVTDGQIESLRSGWTQLFTDGLKSFVES